MIQSGVDVVLIAGTSHFHPIHLKAAVAAGKHVFCEKPHGIDVPGVKMAMAAAEEAKKKNLCLVSGLCWRYDQGVRETMKRVHDGQIGDIVAIQETYITRPYILRERKPEWNEMEYQLQNWYHFNWLSGDRPSQQLIHSIDKASWALGDVTPVKAWGMGGRQVCVEPKYGDQFDHHAVVYEYAERRARLRLLPPHPRLLQRDDRRDLRHQGPGRSAVQSAHRGRKTLALSKVAADHVRRRAQGNVRGHPRRQDDQQRQLHVHQLHAGDPRPRWPATPARKSPGRKP